MTADEAMRLYRLERAKSERRNSRKRMIEQAVLHHRWHELLKRSRNPFRTGRNLLGEPRPQSACTRPAGARARRWNPNGQLLEG